MNSFTESHMRCTMGLVLVVMMALAPQAATAQFAVGAHAGYDFESGYGLAGVSAHVPISIGAIPRTTISGQFEGLLTGDVLALAFNTSIRFHPFRKPESKVDPYFGGGMSLAYEDITGSFYVTPHLVSGLLFPLTPKGGPMLEFHVSFGGFDQTAIVGGWMLMF